MSARRLSRRRWILFRGRASGVSSTAIQGTPAFDALSCAEQFRVMAFAQLTWRESLRDIEVTLAANQNRLYTIGLRHDIRRSTLADANESRDWRIWSDFAAVLIRCLNSGPFNTTTPTPTVPSMLRQMLAVPAGMPRLRFQIDTKKYRRKAL
jgi:hypothetical protein